MCAQALMIYNHDPALGQLPADVTEYGTFIARDGDLPVAVFQFDGRYQVIRDIRQEIASNKLTMTFDSPPSQYTGDRLTMQLGDHQAALRSGVRQGNSIEFDIGVSLRGGPGNRDLTLFEIFDQPPVGLPVITGTAEEYGALRADVSNIEDPDGIRDNEFAYQWLRGGSRIQGATNNSYRPTAANVGHRLAVRVTYHDENDNRTELDSALTDPVRSLLREVVLRVRNQREYPLHPRVRGSQGQVGTPGTPGLLAGQRPRR